MTGPANSRDPASVMQQAVGLLAAVPLQNTFGQITSKIKDFPGFDLTSIHGSSLAPIQRSRMASDHIQCFH